MKMENQLSAREKQINDAIENKICMLFLLQAEPLCSREQSQLRQIAVSGSINYVITPLGCEAEQRRAEFNSNRFFYSDFAD